VAENISVTTDEDTTCILGFNAISGADDFWDLETTYTITSDPQNGHISYDEDTKTFTYTPNNNFNGIDTFAYKAYDGSDYSEEEASVTINVTAQPDSPTVPDYTIIVTDPGAQYNLVLVGSDPDEDTLTYSSNSSGLPGTFTLNSSSGNAVFTSTSTSFETKYGLYTVTYTATDPGGNVSNTGYIYIVLKPKNVWFVDPENTGIQTGKCWHQAFRKIYDAISVAQPGDQIWLAGNTTHTLHDTKDEGSSTYIIADLEGKFDTDTGKGISIIGGFTPGNYFSISSDPVNCETILDGGNQAEHVVVAENYCTLKNITIRYGKAQGEDTFALGGGIYVPENKNNISINNVSIINSTAVSGGGLYIDKNCNTVSITNSTLSNNTSETRGGGAAIAEGSSVSMSNTYFMNNVTSDYGGGLSNLGIVTATNCHFIRKPLSLSFGNQAKYGAGLYDHNNNSSYTNCTFSGNTSSQSGGGIFNFGNISLNNCSIAQNKATLNGGGIVNDASGLPLGIVNVQITDCNISNNVCEQYGGGIYNLHSKVSIDILSNDSTIENNSADSGAGIYCTEGAELNLKNTSIESNTVNNSGGGIYADGYSSLTINNSSINNNTSETNGGGIYLSYSDATLNSTGINSNSASNSDDTTGKGGGVYICNYSSFIFNNLSFTTTSINGNSAATHGGGIYSLQSTIYIQNAHISKNKFLSETNSGDGAGIYAENSHTSLDSVYIEKNWGLANIQSGLPVNYSGYNLKNGTQGSLNLLKSSFDTDTDTSYNEAHGNYLRKKELDYENSTWNYLRVYTHQFSHSPAFL